LICEDGNYILKKIDYNPGLLKLFDEILTNALDNETRKKGKHPQTYMKIGIEKDGMVWV
jgi:DNA gyrase/topoisomerase IV subunit B